MYQTLSVESTGIVAMRKWILVGIGLLGPMTQACAADYLKCSHNGISDVSVALDITVAEAVKDGRTNPEW